MFSLITIIIISPCLVLFYGSPMISADNLNYKLTENVFPENYTLKISPHFNNSTFTGFVKILIHVKHPTKTITLHQKDLNITKEKIFLTKVDHSVVQIENAGVSGSKEQEFYTITFPDILNDNFYYLHIPEFYGVLNTIQKGFYSASYTDENGELRKFAMTKFEPTSARYAFPCFDEPSFRAKFKIYIVRPSNYHSISNTKLRKSMKLNNDLYEDEFELTVSMSTYLLAYIVSEMKLLHSRNDNFHGILARPEMVKQSCEKYALNHSIKVQQALEKYFNVKYPLKKLDQAAIPDFSLATGATECWGFVLYRESGFLVSPETKTKQKLIIDSLIAHEITHQWFGNLVTIKWWKYLWLKEGFAKFLESKICHKVKPEWRRMEQFIVKEKQEMLESDSYNKTRAMNKDVGTPREIESLYDKIAYTKSACIIHMLESIMTPKVFQRGLTNFLQDKAFQSAVPTDLYRSLQKSLDDSAVELSQNLNISTIMTTWVAHRGYPLVYVERHYDKSPEVVNLKQSHYVSIEVARMKPTAWHIPINYATKKNPNFNDTGVSNWLMEQKDTIIINNLEHDDWLIVNKQEAYYYRVNYDITNWKLIAEALEENYTDIHVLNRVQILDDSFSLAKTDKLDFSIPLEISSYVYLEDNYIIHVAFLRYMDYIANLIFGTNTEPNFQNFVMQSLKRSYERLGTHPRATDTPIDKLHRLDVVKWMCKFNYSECRADAWNTFDQWRNNNKSLDVDLERMIMCNAMRHGNEDDWTYLLDQHEATSNPVFKERTFAALGCVENVSLLLQYIDFSLNSTSNYSLNRIVSIISINGLVGFNFSMVYLSEHFNLLLTSLGSENIAQVLATITSFLTTQEQLDEFTASLKKNRIIGNQFLKILSEARLRISQNRKHRQQISKFFESNGYRNDPAVFRSDGILSHTIPNIFAFILYTFITVIFALEN